MDSNDSSSLYSYNGSNFGFKVPQNYRSSFSSFTRDEGFSEETRSQTEGDVVMDTDPVSDSTPNHLGLSSSGACGLAEWVLNLDESKRLEFAYKILQTLRTPAKAAVVELLMPYLHLDPVQYLPPEITGMIFSYLDPISLVRASTISRRWRERTLDSELWKRNYKNEGWGMNLEEVHKCEIQSFQEGSEREAEERPSRRENRKARARQATSSGDDTTEPKLKKRHVEISRSLTSTGLRREERDNADAHMIDAPSPVKHDVSRQEMSIIEAPRERNNVALATVQRPQDFAAQIKRDMSLMIPRFPGMKLNWRFLFYNRLRLERNWDAGRFRRFELPLPQYTNEAHRDCVYTIQYSSKYLVSGSRDRTLRIWDLRTGRLLRGPLIGHEASVLCLQFDDRPGPDHDIIVSGGSDFAVIVWRFSTGEIIKHIKPAHHESVLNLRFDDRYLVTCSKDKTIRIWNRREITTLDPIYPRIKADTHSAKLPSYILNIDGVPFSQLEARLAAGTDKPLAPFTCLMKLEGHGAAVNAVQIHNNLIVSASGDRTLKVWNINNGQCLKTIPAHDKGIACVQFDGRRIVSGSSDKSIRIFDSTTGAEVASLKGHTNLVRTIQAWFGDVPGSELRSEAEAAEHKYVEEVRAGIIPAEPLEMRSTRRRREATAADGLMTAYRAMLPPGGGGSQWGRIVSGSYDETLLIWKKNKEGKWVVSQKLRHDDALGIHSTGSSSRRLRPHQNHGQPPNTGALVVQTQPHVAPNTIVQAEAQNGLAGHVLPLLQNNVPSPTPGQLPQPPNASQPTTHAHPEGAAAITTHQVQPQIQAQAHHHIHHMPLLPNATTVPAQIMLAMPATVMNNNNGINPGFQAQLQNLGAQARPQQGQMQYASQPTSRVFKLQFDARRIICCSQHWKIVGWDFANGDKEIEESSRFFEGP